MTAARRSTSLCGSPLPNKQPALLLKQRLQHACLFLLCSDGEVFLHIGFGCVHDDSIACEWFQAVYHAAMDTFLQNCRVVPFQLSCAWLPNALGQMGGGHVPNSAQVDAALVEGGFTSSTAPGTEAPTALLSMYADDVPKQLRTHTHRHLAYSGCAQASEWLMVLPPMPFSVTLCNNSTHAYRSPGPCSSIQ